MDAERLDAERLKAIKTWAELGMLARPSEVLALIAEVERLTVENQRLTSELNLARDRFEDAVMAAGWERATMGESR